VKYSLRGSQTRSTFTLPDDLWPVEVDREQFGQVISNLIANADQSMRGAGRIAIAAKDTHVSAGDVPWLATDRYIKISITDRGQGIPTESLSQIFDPFFTTGEPGRRLGLTIAYSIIQRHGGHITVVSKPEEGTTFTIYLPAASAEPPSQ
jgi:signal transduction histidine kinase